MPCLTSWIIKTGGCCCCVFWIIGTLQSRNLVQWTGLSNTTVSDTINAMLKTGFVHTDGMQKSIGGRRSVIYSINGRYGQFAGIELYAQGVHMALCDAEGHIKNLSCAAPATRAAHRAFVQGNRRNWSSRRPPTSSPWASALRARSSIPRRRF